MISLVIETDLPVISADKTAMRQIFLNLLTNAIKFSHKGDKITVSAHSNEKEIILTVADTGEGIRADQLSKITEPFVKGTGTSHIAAEGAGLGLSIVKSFVTAHKGTLEIESELGLGTSIVVRFPLEDDRLVA